MTHTRPRTRATTESQASGDKNARFPLRRAIIRAITTAVGDPTATAKNVGRDTRSPRLAKQPRTATSRDTSAANVPSKATVVTAATAVKHTLHQRATKRTERVNGDLRKDVFSPRSTNPAMGTEVPGACAGTRSAAGASASRTGPPRLRLTPAARWDAGLCGGGSLRIPRILGPGARSRAQAAAIRSVASRSVASAISPTSGRMPGSAQNPRNRPSSIETAATRTAW